MTSFTTPIWDGVRAEVGEEQIVISSTLVAIRSGSLVLSWAMSLATCEEQHDESLVVVTPASFGSTMDAMVSDREPSSSVVGHFVSELGWTGC